MGSKDKVLPITLNGKKKLEAELKVLLHEERPKVILAIEEARTHGDLSENADYDAAKERQAWIEARVQDIQGQLAGAEVIDTSKLESDTVIFGAFVKVRTHEDQILDYQIVGSGESDVGEGKVSIVSPLGKALVGKRVGDELIVHAPNGEKEYEILEIYFK